MPRYFMRDTPLQALEQLMMSQPGQKPRGGGIYRSPFHYTPKDVACEYCQNYDRKHPCRLCECTCLEERIEAGVLELNAVMRDCFTPSMGPQFRKRMHQQFRERKPQFFQFFLSDAHRRRWTHWRERCWRLSDRNKAVLLLLTAYHGDIQAKSSRHTTRVVCREPFCAKFIGVCRGAGQNANRFRPVSVSCALSAAPGMTSTIIKPHSARFRPSSHFQLRISGRSTPLSRMYWRCSTSLSCIFWTR